MNSYDFIFVFRWVSFRFRTGFLSVSYGFPMCFRWVSDGFPMGILVCPTTSSPTACDIRSCVWLGPSPGKSNFLCNVVLHTKNFGEVDPADGTQTTKGGWMYGLMVGWIVMCPRRGDRGSRFEGRGSRVAVRGWSMAKIKKNVSIISVCRVNHNLNKSFRKCACRQWRWVSNDKQQRV